MLDWTLDPGSDDSLILYIFVTFLSYHLSSKVEPVELKYTKKKRETKIRCSSNFAVNYPLRPLIKEEYEEFNYSNFKNRCSFLVYAIKPASSQVFHLKNVKLEALMVVWIDCILTILSSIWFTLIMVSMVFSCLSERLLQSLLDRKLHLSCVCIFWL